MDTSSDTGESPVFGAMIGLLTGRSVDSTALQNLRRHTTASARHSFWEGEEADDAKPEDQDALQRALRH